jgi:hypothetical protein
MNQSSMQFQFIQLKKSEEQQTGTNSTIPEWNKQNQKKKNSGEMQQLLA